ncbi:zinc-ribbon domain-containing protein [Streptomyces sp. NPDC004059]
MPPVRISPASLPTDATLAYFPDLAAQLYPAEGSPHLVRARHRKDVRWRCPKADDHTWAAPPYRRVVAGAGCPACTGRQASVTNSLASLFPDVAAELDLEAPATAGLTADQIVAGSHRRVGWRCSTCGHRWEATVGPRTDKRRAGCLTCAGHVVTAETNLAVLRPDLAAQWHPTRNGALRPEDVRPGSNATVWWQCPAHEDHQWKAALSARSNPTNPTGCPACSGYQISATNNLAALFPAIARQLDPALNQGRTADQVLAGTHDVVTWRCPAGPDHIWSQPVVARTAQ